MCEDLLVVMPVVVLFFPLRLLIISDFAHGFKHSIIFFVALLVPIHIIFASNLFNFPPISVGFFNQGFPSLQIEPFVLIQLRLFAADGQIQRRAVRYFSIVVQEPEISTDKGRKTNEILRKIS